MDKYLTLAFSFQLFPRRTSWELSISLSSTTCTWTQVLQVKQPRIRPACFPWPQAAHELWRKIWYEHSHRVGRSILERKWVKSVALYIFPWESLQLLIHLGLGVELRISGIQLASQPSGSYSCAERNILKLWLMSFHEPLGACHLPACFSFLLFLMRVVHDVKLEISVRKVILPRFLKGDNAWNDSFLQMFYAPDASCLLWPFILSIIKTFCKESHIICVKPSTCNYITVCIMFGSHMTLLF